MGTQHRQRASAVGVVVAVNAIAIVGLWLHHGGLDALSTAGGPLTAVGQLTGLLGTYAVLLEVLLMSRIAWLERSIGFDRLAAWHRWTGFASVTLLVGHAIFITLGYAESGNQGLLAQVGD
ncbi:MAG: oxidoreductase, partial [Acidimicrobiia bacterium]|nr:oxidoreductase [Acidimicrobiia bacterium]